MLKTTAKTSRAGAFLRKATRAIVSLLAACLIVLCGLCLAVWFQIRGRTDTMNKF